jgi:hypothetical protein
MQEVEIFLGENADLQKEFALLKQAVFVPSPIVFEQKESLYRQEEKRKVVPFYWVRMAAAVVALMIGCWFLIARSLKSNALETEQAQHALPIQKMPLAEIKKADKGNQGVLADQASAKTNPELVKNTAGAQFKSETVMSKKNNLQTTAVISEGQNADQNEIPDEPMLTMKKATTPEVQSTDNPGDKNPTQVSAISGAEASVLVLASVDKTEQVSYDEPDNAISVVSLNNNKGISGFLKKITKRNPADDQSRKLRVSVFQISY